MTGRDDAAIALVHTYHDCWSKADLDGMMACCHDDFVLCLNEVALNGKPLHLHGKAEVVDFLAPIAAVAECTTSPISCSFQDGVVKAQISAAIKHRRTGHEIQTTYRQIIQVYGSRMLSSDEYHDAAKMRAFWEMVKADDDGRD